MAEFNQKVKALLAEFRAYGREKSLTVREIASKLRMAGNKVCQWVRGEGKFTRKDVAALDKFLKRGGGLLKSWRDSRKKNKRDPHLIRIRGTKFHMARYSLSEYAARSTV